MKSKILAILAVVAMLCSVLPLGGLTVAAETVVYSWDFESGLGTWKSNDATNAPVAAVTPPVANPNGGSYALQQIISNNKYPYMVDATPFTVETNTDYILTLDALNTSSNWPLQALVGTDSWFGGTVLVTDNFKPSKTEWGSYSFEFNSGSNTKLYVGVKSAWTNSTVYFDNIKIVKKVANPDPEIPAGDNLVLNGDFEAGEANWTFSSGTHEIVTDVHGGDKALKLTNPGKWDGAAVSKAITVNPGSSYTIYWWSKQDNSSGTFNLYIVGDYTPVAGINWMVDKTNTWKLNQWTIKPTGNSIQLKFSTEMDSNPGSVIVDDVVMLKEPESSFDGYIYNGDFEIGTTQDWSVHSNTTITSDAHTGNYAMSATATSAWGEAATQTIQVEANSNYTLTFWTKRVSGSGTFHFMIFDNVLKDNDHRWGSKYFSQTSSDWVQYTIEFNSNTSTSLFLKICPEKADSGVFLFDDIVMIKEVDPSFDGYIYNGDFETGKASGWSLTGYATVEPAAKKDGVFGVHVNDTTKHWAGYFSQTFTVKKKTDYILTFTFKCLRNGFNVKVYSDSGTPYDGNDDIVLNSKYLNNKDWTTYQLGFNSDSLTTLIVTFSSGNTEGGDEFYMDNISIGKLGGEDPTPNTILTGGQTSIREKVAGTQITSALAFRFDVKASGAVKDAFNKYVSGSAIVTPFSDVEGDYELLRAGAVMTNKNDIGKDDEALVLTNVDGKKVLNIEAVYLADVAADSFSFAVRIINIPDANLSTNIYARPYYVYEDEDGNEVTVYGETKSDNYEHVADPKAHIKVLAIGNSFSVDAMNNHLYKVLEDAGYKDIVLGNLYIGGCSLDTHWSNINSGLGNYTYYKNSGSGWTTTSNYKANTAIAEEDWDIITIQQASPDSGRPNTYINLNNIVEYVNENKTNPNARIYWHMTWAYNKTNSNSGYANYGNDQTQMYYSITDTVKDKVLTNSLIDGVIPSGTSIQNMRTSGIDETLLCSSDGYHLSDNYGDYIAALTWYAYFSGEDVSGITYQPDVISADVRADINDAVMGAMESPLAITKLNYDQTKSIKVLSIGHSFSIDVMGTYLYDMLKQAGYTDITLGYLYYPGCPLSQHWDWIENNIPATADQGDARFSKKNSDGDWVTVAYKPYTIDVLRNEDWDFVTLQASPDYVGGNVVSSDRPGGGKTDYAAVPKLTNWIYDNALNANVEVKFHMIWAFSQDCELWSNAFHKDPATGKYSQLTMYENIVKATKQYIVPNTDIKGIIPSGTSVQNARTSLIGDNFNEPVVPGTQADGYHLNTKYGDFTGSLTWACYFSGVDANTITSRSDGMTETEFAAIAEAVNNALADWDSVTESSFKN